MIEIGMNQIVKNFGFENVLDGISLEIMTGERVGLVGRNGTGKSTILKIISGEESIGSGTIGIRRGATIGFLEQIPKLRQSETSTKEVLMESFAHLHVLEEKMRDMEAKMTEEQDSDKLQKLIDDYVLLQGHFESQGGYSTHENFNRITTGLNLIDLLERPYNVLSGGQKTIVNLACVMLGQPNILLLDEPTNHLDVKTLEWLEGFLSKYRGTVVIVSHDRYFLDRVITKTIVLEKGDCTTFTGNYSFSIKEQERLLLIEFEQYKNQQKKISAMKAAIKRYRDWGTQADNAKFFKKAKELEKRLEKLEIMDKPQLEKAKIPLGFSGTRSSQEVLKLKDFSLSYGELCLFDQAELLVWEKEKVCLTGDNGTGKTALMKSVLGESSDFSGILSLAENTQAGYIPQEIRFPYDTDTILEAFTREHPCHEGEARNLLAKYFFCGDNVFKRVSKLSGGEKVLLKLAILMQNRVNFLVLDEPTNHIDIETRELLEEALLEFTGTLFFVSHDRYFIHKLANRIVEVKDHLLNSFYGNYSDYRAFVLANEGK